MEEKEAYVNIYKTLVEIISFFIPIKKNKITFIRRSFSGSNISPVVERMKTQFPKLDIKIVDTSPSEKQLKIGDFIKRAILYSGVLQSNVIVTTHGPFIKTNKNITIELWHGFPTKKLSTFSKSSKRHAKRFNRMTDYFVSYSDFASLLYNTRYRMPTRKFVALGSPRNDYLFSEIPDLFHKEYRKVIIYAPTFRESKMEAEELPLNFWFKEFSIEKFYEFLLKNNYLFIWKLHPNEERRWKIFKQEKIPSNFLILTDSKLREMKVDFYQLLSQTDILITDYSSIYADYLLLGRPIIFIPADLEKYDLERGLLLNPYDKWMPGPKCRTQQELQNEIDKCLRDDDYYKRERLFLKEIFHQYRDGKSTDRVVQFIMSKLEN